MAFEEMIEVETVMLPGEDGKEHEYAILDDFQLDGKNYMVIAVIEGDEIAEEMELLRYREEGDDMIFDIIEDEEELQRAAEFYDSLPIED
jgi:uncharacterized protein YrzB (UPF0473 family)